MIDSMLLSLAIVNGTIKFEERREDVRMYANVLGVKVTLSLLSKKELSQLLARTADGSVAPAAPVERPAMARTAPVTPAAPSVPPRRGFRLELVK